MTKKQRALEVIERLKKRYPDADCTLDYDQAWMRLGRVRLAAQCTDARVNGVVEDLYAKYPTVDALAAAEPGRLFRTVQLSDSGIVPGSGVGNSRQALSRRTQGVPVIAVGVPTVVDAFSLFRQAELELDVPRGVLVTMQDVDTRVREMGRLVGYSCDLALHRGLSLGEIPAFLS